MKRFYTENSTPEELLKQRIREAVVNRRDTKDKGHHDRAAVIENSHNDSTKLLNCKI